MKIARVAVDLPLAGLTEPRTVDFISDIHLRNQPALDDFISASRAVTSDVLLLGGDYCEQRQFLEPLFEHLAACYPRIFAVYGNNDELVADRLESFQGRSGVRILRDESVAMDGFTLWGTRDPEHETPRPPPLGVAPLLVLSHSPDILLTLPADRAVSILAGHVHGGQIRIPGISWWWSHTKVGRRYGEGRSTRGRNELFVGRGIGCSLMDIRTVPREIYTVTLRPVTAGVAGKNAEQNAEQNAER